MIGIPGSFNQFPNNNIKANPNPTQNMNKNNFIPNIIPVTNNMPESLDQIDNQEMATEILNISKINQNSIQMERRNITYRYQNNINR